MRRIRCLFGFHDEIVAVLLPDRDDEELARITRRDPEMLAYFGLTKPTLGVRVTCRRCDYSRVTVS